MDREDEETLFMKRDLRVYGWDVVYSEETWGSFEERRVSEKSGRVPRFSPLVPINRLERFFSRSRL